MSYLHFASIVGTTFDPLEIVHVQGDEQIVILCATNYTLCSIETRLRDEHSMKRMTKQRSINNHSICKHP